MALNAWIGVALAALVAGPTLAAPQEKNAVTQYSLISALMQQTLDGEMTIDELRRRGDFGIGTFNGLDGEMVAIDGHFYQAKADGSVSEAGGGAKIPYAAVAFFQADQRASLPAGTGFDTLSEAASLQYPNNPYLIRIDGVFSHVKARAPRRQRLPYPSFDKVLAEQAVFELADIEGTMVGFYFPAYAKGLNVPGFHLHFISKGRDAGGHALSFATKNAKIALANTRRWVIELPRGEAFQAVDFSRDAGSALQVTPPTQHAQ